MLFLFIYKKQFNFMGSDAVAAHKTLLPYGVKQFSNPP